jgi:hypothetical protein
MTPSPLHAPSYRPSRSIDALHNETRAAGNRGVCELCKTAVNQLGMREITGRER